jgi:hypothetical protein
LVDVDDKLTYPTKADIELHKDKLWQMLILTFKDMTPEMGGVMKMGVNDIANALRSLAGDASLWIYNNEHKDLDMKKVGKFISTLRVINIEEGTEQTL